MEYMRNANKLLVGKPDRKRPLVRPRLRCEDNIKVDYKKHVRRVWTGCNWLRIGTSGRRVRTW
jgi:hypothetical protein